jgi:hypothetical protein
VKMSVKSPSLQCFDLEVSVGTMMSECCAYSGALMEVRKLALKVVL